MTEPTLHLVKLCVGAEDPAALALWQQARAVERAAAGRDPRPRHTTRMAPRRAEELLAGGSLYWVFKGAILARQRLEAIEPIDSADGLTRHDLVLAPSLIATAPQPRRPFQGWRYLTAADAPADLTTPKAGASELPSAVREAVATYGVI